LASRPLKHFSALGSDVFATVINRFNEAQYRTGL